jgi:hypothetical protein
MKIITAITGGLLFISTPVFAQMPDPGMFGPILDPQAPECLPLQGIMDKIQPEKILMNNDQFQSLRAMYVVLPPPSKKLPPGNHAYLLKKDSVTIAVLVGNGAKGEETCARFMLPNFLIDLLVQIGEGRNEQIGDPS